MMNSPVPPKGSTVFLLARHSSNLQNPLSTQDQIDVGLKDAERLGWHVGGVFKDEAKSGLSVANRTGYLEMMAAAEAGRADVIWVFSLDRLGRNARELHDARNRLADVEAVIYTHDRGVMSRMEFSIWAEMAQMESEKMSDRVRRGGRAAAQRGQHMGDVPYGYRLVREEAVDAEMHGGGARRPPARLEVDPVTSKLVLRAHLDYEAGKSPTQIAAQFTNEGIPTAEGKHIWHPNSISGIKGALHGLLRNPTYVGRVIYGKRKTRRDPKTGKVVKEEAKASEMIEYDAPWLRIIPDDLWERNQARLEARSFELPHKNRRPDYLLSGLTRCGVCGQPYTMVAQRLGCTGRRVKACDNGRRVSRGDVERAVLEGLSGRLSQPTIMELVVPEYLREAQLVGTEGEDRHERAQKRLGQVVQEIDNLIAQVTAGAAGYAAQILNEKLDALGAERERLNRDLKAPKAPKPEALTTAFVLQRVEALLAGLGEALNGEERDATRARDIIRSFITAITITPMDHNGKRDGRGAGPVRVVVEGAIRSLVDHALLDRVILPSPVDRGVQDHPIAKFRFYIDITEEFSGGREAVFADMAVVARLLDDAEYPVSREDVIDALNDRGRPASKAEWVIDERRQRMSVQQMARNGWIRKVQLDRKNVGWVWNDRAMSDDEWRARYQRRREFQRPIGIIRLGAPAAEVVVVGSPGR